LGNLMKGANNPPPEPDNPARPANLSPGMASLLHGPSGIEDAETNPEPSAQPQPQASPAPSGPAPASPTASSKERFVLPLLLADALLVGLAVRSLLKSQGQPGFTSIALCILAFGVGAWLAWLALWPESQD
jgi:hypothetical protein